MSLTVTETAAKRRRYTEEDLEERWDPVVLAYRVALYRTVAALAVEGCGERSALRELRRRGVDEVEALAVVERVFETYRTRWER